MIRWLAIATTILLLDQYTKTLALKHMVLHNTIVLMPGLNLELAFNPGAAFSMLAQRTGWQQGLLITVGIIVAVVLIVWLKRLAVTNKCEGLALSCILGGALGNLLDRLRFGYVVDFIDVYWHEWHWYTFNVADTFITIGTILLIWTIFNHNRVKGHV